MKPKSTFSRRNWIKQISAGMTGLLIAEQAPPATKACTEPKVAMEK